MSGRGGGGRAPTAAVDGLAPEATDFANYFCTYAFLYHQVTFLPVQIVATCSRVEHTGLVIPSGTFAIAYCWRLVS